MKDDPPSNQLLTNRLDQRRADRKLPSIPSMYSSSQTDLGSWVPGISEAVYHAVRGNVKVRDLGVLRVKGRTGPVHTCELLGLIDRDQRSSSDDPARRV